MDAIRTLLEQQPLVAMFLTIALGYLVGEINLRGFSLGVGAVLFVGLAVGWLAPGSAPAPIVGTLGLSLFLYAVGVQYGAEFVRGWTSARGLQANALALFGVLLSGALSVGLVGAAELEPAHALGLFAGAGTSTPTLQAAIVATGGDDPAIGYSVAYPFGVAGPILLLYAAYALRKPDLAPRAGSGMELLEIALKAPRFFARRLGDVMAELPAQVQIAALRRDRHNEPASPNTLLAENDVLLAVGPTQAVLEEVRASLGEAAPGRFTADRSDLDYVRVFASRPAVVGRMLADLELPGEKASAILHVRRGDADLLARPDLVLELGDRLGVLANRADFPAMRRYFGDSIKGTAEFSYISIGLGIALGLLLGMVAIPVPGVGAVSFGLSGVLIVALILGQRRRTAGLNWTMPLSANLVLRNLGLTLFLAQVAMASGSRFVATIAETGFLLLGLGALILLALVGPIVLLGLFVLRLPFDEVAGIVAGACGNPAILAYSNKLAPTDAPDVGYAMIFPGMTLAKILFVDVAAAFL